MKDNFLPTGQIVNTHGLRGDVKVMPWADDPDDLLDLDRVFIDGKEYQISHSSRQKNMILMKLRGVDSIDDAVKLRNKEISLCRDDIELEEGVMFIADMIGLPVVADGEEIGKLKDVIVMPGNDVYVVRGEHEYMIPAVQEYVEPLDPKEGVIKVHLIEGMRTDAD